MTNQAENLAIYIRSLPDFRIVVSIDDPYGHIGATLTDAVLQAGINYKKVVQPRAERVRDAYPEAQTTSGFAHALEQFGVGRVLNWGSGPKPERLQALVSLLLQNGIETENQLRIWLENPANLQRLRQIKGIKDKTAHYLHILVGAQTSPLMVTYFDSSLNQVCPQTATTSLTDLFAKPRLSLAWSRPFSTTAFGAICLNVLLATR